MFMYMWKYTSNHIYSCRYSSSSRYSYVCIHICTSINTYLYISWKFGYDTLHWSNMPCWQIHPLWMLFLISCKMPQAPPKSPQLAKGNSPPKPPRKNGKDQVMMRMWIWKANWTLSKWQSYLNWLVLDSCWSWRGWWSLDSPQKNDSLLINPSQVRRR